MTMAGTSTKSPTRTRCVGGPHPDAWAALTQKVMVVCGGESTAARRAPWCTRGAAAAAVPGAAAIDGASLRETLHRFQPGQNTDVCSAGPPDRVAAQPSSSSALVLTSTSTTKESRFSLPQVIAVCDRGHVIGSGFKRREECCVASAPKGHDAQAVPDPNPNQVV